MRHATYKENNSMLLGQKRATLLFAVSLVRYGALQALPTRYNSTRQI